MSSETLPVVDDPNKEKLNSNSSEKENKDSIISKTVHNSERHEIDDENNNVRTKQNDIINKDDENNNVNTKSNGITIEDNNSTKDKNKNFNEETPLENKTQTPTKEKKKINTTKVIIGLVGIFMLLSIILLLIITNKKKFKDPSSTNNDSFYDATNEDNDVLSPENMIESLSYKKNEINIYKDTQ